MKRFLKRSVASWVYRPLASQCDDGCLRVGRGRVVGLAHGGGYAVALKERERGVAEA